MKRSALVFETHSAEILIYLTRNSYKLVCVNVETHTHYGVCVNINNGRITSYLYCSLKIRFCKRHFINV